MNNPWQKLLAQLLKPAKDAGGMKLPGAAAPKVSMKRSGEKQNTPLDMQRKAMFASMRKGSA